MDFHQRIFVMIKKNPLHHGARVLSCPISPLPSGSSHTLQPTLCYSHTGLISVPHIPTVFRHTLFPLPGTLFPHHLFFQISAEGSPPRKAFMDSLWTMLLTQSSGHSCHFPLPLLIGLSPHWTLSYKWRLFTAVPLAWAWLTVATN